MSAVDWAALQRPFAAEDIEWRVQQSGMKNGKPWAMVLAYVTNRAIQQRLDETVTPAGWCNTYTTGPDDGVLCGISIRIGDEWVTKWDGAENTQVEAVKGGLSGAMKRAAVQWGIGRYLYRLEATFAEVFEGRGQNRIAIKYKADNREQTFYGAWNDPQLPAWALPSAPARQPERAEPPQEEHKHWTPPVTDKAWLAEWSGEVAVAETTIRLLELQSDLLVATRAKRLSPTDANDAMALLREKRADLDKKEAVA